MARKTKTRKRKVLSRVRRKRAERANGPWLPASGGTETPFMSRSGIRMLYCYQPSTGRHRYLNVDNDMIMDDETASRALDGKLGKYAY